MPIYHNGLNNQQEFKPFTFRSCVIEKILNTEDTRVVTSKDVKKLNFSPARVAGWKPGSSQLIRAWKHSIPAGVYPGENRGRNDMKKNQIDFFKPSAGVPWPLFFAWQKNGVDLYIWVNKDCRSIPLHGPVTHWTRPFRRPLELKNRWLGKSTLKKIIRQDARNTTLWIWNGDCSTSSFMTSQDLYRLFHEHG